MVRGSPKDANEFIEQQLHDRLSSLEVHLNSDMLSFNGPLVFGIDDIFRNAIESIRRRPQKRSSLTILLTTEGGYIEVVHRIVDTIRHHYSQVNFIIPSHAYSAGTVLVMSGDCIYMDYYSRLGPIDPQVQTARGAVVPALGYLIKWERLCEKAADGNLTMAEMQLMIDGFDQAELYKYEQERELSIALLEEWLAKYKFKNWKVTETQKKKVTTTMRKQRAHDIAAKLNDTETWHTHGYGISIQVLQRKLKLLIDDFGKNTEMNEKIKDYHELLTDYMTKRRARGIIHTIGNYLPFAWEDSNG